MEVTAMAVIAHVRLYVIQIVISRAVNVFTSTARFYVATVEAKLQLFTLQLALASQQQFLGRIEVVIIVVDVVIVIVYVVVTVLFVAVAVKSARRNVAKLAPPPATTIALYIIFTQRDIPDFLDVITDDNSIRVNFASLPIFVLFVARAVHELAIDSRAGSVLKIVAETNLFGAYFVH